MNNKELIAGMSARLGKSPKDVQQMVSAFVTEMASHLSEDDSLAIQGFGTFEVKKKLERIVTNPNTKQKMLVPPRLALSFKPSLMLKDKIKKLSDSKSWCSGKSWTVMLLNGRASRFGEGFWWESSLSSMERKALICLRSQDFRLRIIVLRYNPNRFYTWKKMRSCKK